MSDAISSPLAPSLRGKVERTIEALIDLLDTLEGDADAEPSLGSLERHPASWERPWRQPGELRHDASGSQLEWSAGETYDGEDDAGENGEPDVDGEYDLGWQEEGSQASLNGSDLECELGTPEQINQVARLERSSGWFAENGEPDLGFVGHGTGWRNGEQTDDSGEYDPADDGEYARCP